MTPRNAGLTHTGPSNNNFCRFSNPDEKFSKLTLSSRKRLSNLQLISSQSPAKKVKKLIDFFDGGFGGKAGGQNLHTEPAKITEEGKTSTLKPKVNQDSDYLLTLEKLKHCEK